MICRLNSSNSFFLKSNYIFYFLLYISFRKRILEWNFPNWISDIKRRVLKYTEFRNQFSCGWSVCVVVTAFGYNSRTYKGKEVQFWCTEPMLYEDSLWNFLQESWDGVCTETHKKYIKVYVRNFLFVYFNTVKPQK